MQTGASRKARAAARLQATGRGSWGAFTLENPNVPSHRVRAHVPFPREAMRPEIITAAAFVAAWHAERIEAEPGVLLRNVRLGAWRELGIDLAIREFRAELERALEAEESELRGALRITIDREGARQ